VKEMLWIVQKDLWDEAGYVKFVEALDRLGIEYMIIRPVPFTNKILPADFDSFEKDISEVEEPYIDTDQDIMAFGATSLTRIAKAKKWYPGTFMNENFTFEKWSEGFGKENILNPDSIVQRLGDHFDLSVFEGSNVFVRPVLDSKTFNGEVKSKYDFKDWQQSIKFMDDFMTDELVDIPMLNKDTIIAVSSAKKIYSECRMFIVNNTVVTASMYKFGNVVKSDANVDRRFREFANAMMARWVPTEAYVMDVADTPDGLKVIEINNINSAGFYDSDPQKIIMSIENLVNYEMSYHLKVDGEGAIKKREDRFAQ
jgi:hypothetical protein